MKRFILDQSNDSFYASHSGLALVCACTNHYSGLVRTFGRVAQGSDHIAEIDIICSYLGQLYRDVVANLRQKAMAPSAATAYGATQATATIADLRLFQPP